MDLPAEPAVATLAIQCHRCGYDVRAQPADGICPECAASVAESRRVALTPKRPAWRDSDPRWRRRMLAGLWVLVFMPLMYLLAAFRLDASTPWPSVFGGYGAGTTFLDTFVLSDFDLLMFSIGLVLLFSKERGRQANGFDWTRRWGVLLSYLMLILGMGGLLLIVGLVLSGIAALFQSMPLQYQPAITGTILQIGTGLIYYGPQHGPTLYISTAGCSSALMLLAAAPIYSALRSCGSRRMAIILLAPLLIEAVLNFIEAVRANTSSTKSLFFSNQYSLLFFDVREFAAQFGSKWQNTRPWATTQLYTYRVELRWFCVLLIAIRLSVAQLLTYLPRRTSGDSSAINVET